MIKILIDKNFEGFSPFQIVQFFRGSGFLLIDKLIKFNYALNESPDILVDKALSYFKKYLNLSLEYFKKLPTLYHDVKTH